jgi:hypothetical protein
VSTGGDGIDAFALAGAKAKGKRPYFFKDPDVERLLNITLALAQELAVTRERLDTLERLLERGEPVSKEAVEAFTPTKAEAAERGQWMQEYLARIFRILQQEREALDRVGEASPEDVAEELARK